MGFSENLRAIRIKRGYSQQQLAQKIPVSRQTISSWENPSGKQPQLTTLIRLAEVLNVSTDELLKGGESKIKQSSEAESDAQWQLVSPLANSMLEFAEKVGIITRDAFSKSQKGQEND